MQRVKASSCMESRGIVGGEDKRSQMRSLNVSKLNDIVTRVYI